MMHYLRKLPGFVQLALANTRIPSPLTLTQMMTRQMPFTDGTGIRPTWQSALSLTSTA